LCCYNSQKLLPSTLRHLSSLIIPAQYPVELIFVDNASTDNTPVLAQQIWNDFACSIPITVITQAHQGLAFARQMGFANVRYEYVVFVDDDNWLAEDYLHNVVELMRKYPQLAAAGGRIEPVFEIEKPFWFDRFMHSYATGQLAASFGEPDEIGLFGAGLVIRQSAYQKLLQEGFRSHLIGRSGESLSSGEDYEICKALKIAGWDVFFAPQLRLKHFITSDRLNWEYFINLNRGISKSIVYFLAYEFWIEKYRNPQKVLMDVRYSVQYLIFKKSIKKLLLKILLMLTPKSSYTGSRTFIEYERTSIILSDLLKKAQTFRVLKSEIGMAAWNHISKKSIEAEK